MSASSSTVSYFTSELEVMMAFVLDRSKFLDTVTDAVTYETHDPAAERMIALLENQTFLLTIPALLCDKDLKVRSKAYLALGNLIASDNRKIAQMAFGVAVKGFKYVERGFKEQETFAGSAYALHNIAMRIRDWKELGQDHVKSLVVDTACAKMNMEECTPAAMRDLLHTVHMLGSAADVPTEVLLRLVSTKAKGIHKTALKMLGEQLSDTDFKLAFVRPAYDCYRGLILNGQYNSVGWQEVFWGFSNVVVEDGIADHFLADDDLLCTIIEIATAHHAYVGECEATWVLVNAIAKADVKLPPIDKLHTIVDTIQTFLANYNIVKGNIYSSSQEALEKINTEFVRRFPPEEDYETEEDEDAMEIDEDSTVMGWPITTPAHDEYESLWREINKQCESDDRYGLPCELPSLNTTTADYTPPTAAQLLDATKSYDKTSKIVFELINSVVMGGGAFMAMPDNTVLTKADLVAIESRGFVIIRGSIGVNPLLSAAFYSF